jgi:D-amino-acid dehydrogenase
VSGARRKRLVIAGAGIVGICCGIFAQRKGWEVTLVDPRGLGLAASSGNAGVVAVSECVPIGTPGTIASVPRMLLSADSPLQIRLRYLPRLLPWLARMALASTPAKVESASIALAGILDKALDAHFSVADPAGVRSSITPTGWLKVFETASAFDAAQGDFDLMRRRGIACDVMDAEAIARQEPGLASIFKHAVFHPACHHVGDPGIYVGALGKHFIGSGGKSVKAEVAGFRVSQGKVDGVLTDAGLFEADAVVVAAGAWSRRLAGQLGAKVPLDTERGYNMMLETPVGQPLRGPVYWAERSIVMSPMGKAVRVTSSVEFAGLNAAPDYSQVLKSVQHVRRALPALAPEPSSTWLGFRPSMPDSLPVIGRVPKFTNAFLAFGHGHLGLTLGPVTGRLIADALGNERTELDLAPFSPDRF